MLYLLLTCGYSPQIVNLTAELFSCLMQDMRLDAVLQSLLLELGTLLCFIARWTNDTYSFNCF